MFCPNCGKEISEKGKFCTACGRGLVAAKEPTKKTSKKKPLLVYAVVFFIFITAVFCWFFLRETAENYCPPAETTKVYDLAVTTNQALTLWEDHETIGKKAFFNGKEVIPYFSTMIKIGETPEASPKLFVKNFSLGFLGVTSASIVGYNLGSWWSQGNYVYTWIEPSYIIFRFPPHIGLAWEQKGYVKTVNDYIKTMATPYEGGEFVTYKFTIVGKEKIEVPAGTFNCWKIESVTTKPDGKIFATGTEWVSKKIGRVKMVRICTDDKSRVEVVLKSYEFRRKSF